MKLYSKESLLLGGIFSISDIITSIAGFTTISEIIFFIFIIFLLLLCFNKKIKFLAYIADNYPKTTYYLCAIGWIPYFVGIVFLCFVIGNYLFQYSKEFALNFIYTLASLALLCIPASLIIAYFRKN